MKISEYKEFMSRSTNTSIDLSGLNDWSDRTLLYGYTSERHTFHVYLRDKKLICYIYHEEEDGSLSETIHTELMPAKCYVPDKRVYPEASDASFCRLLKAQGVHVAFIPFNEARRPARYHGKIALV